MLQQRPMDWTHWLVCIGLACILFILHALTFFILSYSHCSCGKELWERPPI